MTAPRKRSDRVVQHRDGKGKSYVMEFDADLSDAALRSALDLFLKERKSR